MTPTRSGRGRPKGTGLDDSAYLEAIVNLIAANPEMKPTTAIKDLGFTDPSVIRRLRDKYHAAHGQAADSGARAHCGGGPFPQPASAPASQGARSMAAAVERDPRLVAPIQEPQPQTAAISAQAPAKAKLSANSGQTGDASFAKLVGLSVGVLVTSVEAQASIMAYCLRHAPVGAFFQTQVALAEAALSFAAELITTPGSIA